MARMTLAELAAEVQAFLPGREEAAIGGAANFFVRTLNRRKLGFMSLRSTVTTVAPTTHAVTVNQGSATVTMADAAAVHIGQVIQFSGSDVWYPIEAVTVGVDATLASAYEGADIAGGTATIAYPRIELPADLINLERIGLPHRESLVNITGEIGHDFFVNVQTGQPEAYRDVVAINTDDNLEVFLYDFPDAIYTLMVEGTSRIARYGGSGTRCGIPEIYEDVLLAGALFYSMGGEDPNGNLFLFWQKMMDDLLKDAQKRTGPTNVGVMAQATGSHRLWARFPASGASVP
jgi:hypothetical protein